MCIANVAKLQFSLGNWLNRGCTYLRRLAVAATRFCTVARNICESYGWNTLHSTRLEPTILRGFLDRGIYVVFLSPSKRRSAQFVHRSCDTFLYRGADKSLARPGRKQVRKHARDARNFNNIETRAVINLFFLQGKAPEEIYAILTKTSACFLPGRAKDLSSSLYIVLYKFCT